MTLTYGFASGTIRSVSGLKATHRKREIQYHLHAQLDAGDAAWELAINVGTNDADDLLRYRLVYDFHHPLTTTLRTAGTGFTDLTGQAALPALDFRRSDVLADTGNWRLSDPMDGTLHTAPAGPLERLLQKACAGGFLVHVFGRSFQDGTPGVHDIHQNQGSGPPFLNDGVSDRNDHNDVWQDGAVLVDLGNDGWAAYFAAFTQQTDRTDELGNPSH